MPRLRKVEVWVDTLQKKIEGHVAYSEGKFRVPLSVEFEHYASELNPQDAGRYIEKRKESNTFSLYKWYSRGRHYVGTLSDTENEAVEYWMKFVKHFYGQQQVVEKVILYRIKFSSLTINNGDDFDDAGDAAKIKTDRNAYRHARQAENDSNGAKIFFDFMVAEKRTIGTKSRYYFVDIKGEQDDIGGRWGNMNWEVMPYSAEAETFFGEVYSGLEGIMKKLSKYCGNQDRIQKSIETSQKLLA